MNSKKTLLIVGWIAAAAVVFLAVTSFGIYNLGWRGVFIDNLISALPYPAAMVNYRIFSIDSFNNRFTAYQKAITYNQAFDFGDPANADLIKEQKQLLFSRMIDLTLEHQVAKKMRVSVSGEEIDRELGQVASFANKNEQELDDLLQAVYGWNRKEFTDQVLVPELIERKLKVIVNSDSDFNSGAVEKASSVFTRLQAGEDFEKVAADSSDDVATKDLGGDLGWTGAGAFVSEFEEAMKKLEPGKFSEPVATQYGLHIIQLVEKNETDPNAVQYNVRHILITGRPFEEWIKAQTDNSTIWKFVSYD